MGTFSVRLHIGWGGEQNIRVWKTLPSKRVLKTLRGSPKVKAQREQYLLALGFGPLHFQSMFTSNPREVFGQSIVVFMIISTSASIPSNVLVYRCSSSRRAGCKTCSGKGTVVLNAQTTIPLYASTIRIVQSEQATANIVAVLSIAVLLYN